MAGLLYSTGLRRIGVPHAAHPRHQTSPTGGFSVRDGKDERDRATMLPENLVQPLQAGFGRCAFSASARPRGRLR